MSKIKAIIDEARTELRKKSIDDIQRETAWKWAARAVAAVEMGAYLDAHEYAHEAVEHAGLCTDDSLITQVRTFLRAHGASPN